MRILNINSYYSTGPFYRQLYDAQAALMDGFRVYVPVPHGYDARAFDFGPYADVVHTHSKWDAAVFQVKHAKVLTDALSRYGGGGFDALHAHSLFSNGYIAMRLAERLELPFIVAVRDTDVNVFFRRMVHLRSLGRKILKKAKKVVFLSEAYQRSALAPYLSAEEHLEVLAKSVVLPNGIDHFFHEHRGEQKREAHEPVRFLFVGQLIPRKNIQAAIEAVRIYRETAGDAQLSVVGRAVSKREYERVVNCPFARYYPPTDRDGLLSHYRENDIFIVPSRTETFGLVYAEAMSQGLPVMYTKGQGFDGQYAPGEVGFPVFADDPSGIAAAAARIVHDMEEISGRCLSASAKYDWNLIARAYSSLYTEVIK